MVYKRILRPILFRINPEASHGLALYCLALFSKLPFAKPILRMIYRRNHSSLKKEVFGITFPNPVGLAGGIDKNGDYYNVLSDLGFGFLEIGSLTPKPQMGANWPRVFRLAHDKALINRMGLNNKGVIHAINHLKQERPDIIIAANIAKNTNTQNGQSAKDYEEAFSLLYDFVDMFVINVSYINAQGSTLLQDISLLSDVMDDILDKRMSMDKIKPVLLKLSPDLDHQQLDDILDYAMRSGVDGIVAGNSTRSRDGLTISKDKLRSIGEGGLSGAPLFGKSLAMVKYIHEKTKGRLPIIGCGGIMTPEQAKEMLDSGADLIEICTGFIYEGPSLVRKILRNIDRSINTK